ncbi:helix-turn-helix domain-containing protein [Dehalococcoidia bacterium]|nr:helix-turn-helix domain-containing protein [Dehalococcoidia bacterium]
MLRRDDLLGGVWGNDCAGNTRTVDYHMLSLRQKIRNEPSCPAHLVAVRGTGYKFEG